ncbi:MAG: MATE family efflux transporter [Lachnospiraceae bacterium]
MKVEKEFYKKLWSLVIPIAFQNFMLALVSASDAIMLGFLDQNALAAVSLASQIQFVHSLFLMAFIIGTTILIAQYWGNKEIGAIEKIFSYVLTGLSQLYLCMLKNTESAGKSTLISSTTVVINIILNAVLIFGILWLPALGIRGAAIATVIARMIELIWSIISLNKKNLIKLKIQYIKQPERILKRDFWKFTAPILGNEIVWGGGITMFSVIMGHLGSDAVAANAIANIVKNLIICVSLGIGSGGSIIVGNELGKGMLLNAQEYGRKLVRLSVLSGVLSGLFLILLRPGILYMSNLNQEASELLSMMLLICAYYLIGKSINATVIGGIFCAGGDTRFGLLCDTITLWAIIIPLGFLGAFYFRLPVILVYFILNMDEMIELPFVYRHYKQYNWVRDLTRKDNKMEVC